MAEPWGDLTREELDQLAIRNGGRVGIGCPKHPSQPTNALYQDGHLRLLCEGCGFEAARIRVAAGLTSARHIRDTQEAETA